MLKTNAKVIVTGVGVVAMATATIAYSEKKIRKKAQRHMVSEMEIYAPCPTCGVMVNKNHERCSFCNSPLQVCESCGHLFTANARYCPKCGTESETSGTVVVDGTTYRSQIKEPFPTDHVSHTYCCCGTPFAENANYCQLCGRKRPKPGTYYLRERRTLENEKDGTN